MTEEVPILQVIDRDLVFCPKMRSFCDEVEFDICDSYFVVAVLGCQSTGKSTLLNLLFGTQFEVMEAARGRSQTTLGVWMGLAGQKSKKKLLIFDVEGTDSKERGEQHTIFERKTALFSLALSEVLILNLMTTDVGRFEGSNYGLLKTVFDLNLQLFTKEVGGPKTLLLFVLRDHDPEDTPLASLKNILMGDMVKLWTDIKKPQQFASSTVHDFFEFEFVSLPHYKYERERWQQDVLDLKERFLGNGDRSDFLLKQEYRTGVPADGFSTFAESVWSTIQSEKDLDLPSQRQMLAVFRCDEISAEALSTIKGLQSKLNEEIITHSTIVSDFGSTTREAIDKAKTYFDSRTVRYERAVVDTKKRKLIDQLVAEFNPLWKNLLLLIYTESKRFLHGQIQTEFADKTKPRMDFGHLSEKIRNSTIEFFSSRASASVIYPDQDPDQKSWKSERDDLFNDIEKELKKARAEQLKLFLEIESEKIIQIFKPEINEVMEESKDNMWDASREIFDRETKKLNQELESVLTEFGSDETEIKQFIEDFNHSCHSFVQSLFASKAKEVYQDMNAAYVSSFQLNNGIPRKWGKNDEGRVSKLHKSSLAKAEKLLDLYSILRLDPKYATTSFFNYSPKTGLTPSRDHSYKQDPEMSKYTLIPSREGKRILEQFRDSATSLYIASLDEVDKAKRAAEIPYYMIIVALILGTNEIWWFLSSAASSTTYLFFSLIFGGIAYAFFALDLWPEVERRYGPSIEEGVFLAQSHLSRLSNGFVPPPATKADPKLTLSTTTTSASSTTTSTSASGETKVSKVQAVSPKVDSTTHPKGDTTTPLDTTSPPGETSK